MDRMVFPPPARETIEMLRSILQKLDETIDPESRDLAYLRGIMIERIGELEAAQEIELSKPESSPTHREAA